MTTYLAWKDPSCNGMNPQWKVLSRKEFLELINSRSFRNRRFIRLHNHGSGGRIVIEASESQYKDWLVEKRHSQYLRDTDPGYKTDSYHGVEADDEDVTGEEKIPDEEQQVEAEVFKALELKALRAAVAQLSEDERDLITYLYLLEEQGTERGYSSLTGVPRMTVHDRKMRILNKLKKLI